MAAQSSMSYSRVQLFAQRIFVMNQSNWLKALLASTGIILVLWLINFLFGTINTAELTKPAFDSYQGFSLFLFLVIGIVIVNDFFKELQEAAKSSQFLMIPASTAEKIISAILLSMIIYIVFAMIVIVALSVIINGVTALTFDGVGFAIFNPFSLEAIASISSFVVMHSIFMFGAVWFRKNNILKTILSIATFFAILAIGFAIFMLFAAYSGWDIHFEHHIDITAFENTMSLARFLFWSAVVALFWFGSFRTLKRRGV